MPANSGLYGYEEQHREKTDPSTSPCERLLRVRPSTSNINPKQNFCTSTTATRTVWLIVDLELWNRNRGNVVVDHSKYPANLVSSFDDENLAVLVSWVTKIIATKAPPFHPAEMPELLGAGLA
ncbi:hypothetical protein VNI00_009139 [Paramarasmius palmivorus]|uniref:Uncharacterized protein n=1 Tax=Paramarasmius palmivorus TaxID=297713 RepID=A0AAW0CNS1_9AGAR